MGYVYTIHVMPNRVHLHVGNKICYFANKRDALRVSKFTSKYVEEHGKLPQLYEYERDIDRVYHILEKNTTINAHEESEFKKQLLLRNLGYHECVLSDDDIVCVDSYIKRTTR